VYQADGRLLYWRKMTQEELDNHTTPKEEPKEEEPKKTRNVERKKLYICEAVGSDDPRDADTFRVVAGPIANTTLAFRHVRDTLPDGKYVLMYEGKTIDKFTEQLTRTRM
jgi:hypothetical protein